MKPLVVDQMWIQSHLPDHIPAALISKCSNFQSYYTEGLKIICEGDRGGFSEVYEAKDDEDLKLWAFMHVCRDIGMSLELKERARNNSKWRYIRSHVQNGDWMYFENDSYVYNTIEDTRLYWFEEYLRLIKPVLPSARFNDEVKRHISLMNRWYKKAHWGYDFDNLAFIEISDSKPYKSDYDDSEEPSPEQIIGK